jgi:hypothetical protein
MWDLWWETVTPEYVSFPEYTSFSIAYIVLPMLRDYGF